jgi:hypothetical protein
MISQTRRVVLLAVAIYALLASDRAFAEGKPAVSRSSSPAAELSVPLGQTAGGFTFSKDGSLSYKGKPFEPAVKVSPESVQKFRISLNRVRSLAGAISEDSDGLSRLFLLDLAARSSTGLPRGVEWTGAQKIFWSPSGRYLVAYFSYEEEFFVGIDLRTKKVKRGDLGPRGRLWRLTNEPQWSKEGSALWFTVNETCDPYEETKCDSERVLARYSVSLDPATLEARRRGPGATRRK